MNHPAIRRLGDGDAVAFHAMLDLFGAAFDEADVYGARRPDHAYIARLLADPGVVLLVAEGAEGCVGALAAYILPKFEQPRSEAYVYDLAVAEHRRRQGVATALIAALKPIARAAGAHTIFVQADKGDEPAIALYGKLGRREDVFHFDIAP